MPLNLSVFAFVDSYRRLRGVLSESQKGGLTQLLSMMNTDADLSDRRWAAYMLATVRHECAETWQPITEFGPREYFDKYEPGTVTGNRLGNVAQGDGYRYRGRGYVQITGLSNYRRLSNRLGLGTDLVLWPDRALNPDIAYRIMSLGMRDGLFTGRALRDYFPVGHEYAVSDTAEGFRKARMIINGMDRASLIAGYAADFYRLLEQCTDRATHA